MRRGRLCRRKARAPARARGVPCVPWLPAFPPGAVGWVCRGPSVPPRPPQPTPERTDDTRLKTVFGWASLIGEMITFSHPEALSCSSLHRALEDENYVLAIGPVVAHESIDDLIERVLQLPLHALAHVKHAGLPVGPLCGRREGPLVKRRMSPTFSPPGPSLVTTTTRPRGSAASPNGRSYLTTTHSLPVANSGLNFI